MQLPVHNLETLFDQLGLPSSQRDIEHFVATHRSLGAGDLLHQAPFWSPGQAAFLKGAVAEDADWAPYVDQLNSMLQR